MFLNASAQDKTPETAKIAQADLAGAWHQKVSLRHELSSCEPCYSWNVFYAWQSGDRARFHRTSDTPEDLHSPVAHTFWQSHIGWVFSPQSDETNEQTVKDLVRYPELRWLDRHYWLPPLSLASLCFLIGGWAGLVWGFFVSSILSHHATFMVNSVCHLWRTRHYATSDASRNNLFVALVTLGEGWHNNHHHYPNSAQQGFRWWELDVSYYLIRLLAYLGLVHDVRKVPRAKLLASSPRRLVGSENQERNPKETRHSTVQREPTTDAMKPRLIVLSNNGQDLLESADFHAGKPEAEEAVAFTFIMPPDLTSQSRSESFGR